MTDEISSHLAAAQSALEKSQFAMAEASCRSCLRIDPRHPDVLHFMGVLLFHTGRREQGLYSVRTSLEFAPHNSHAWNNLGNLLVEYKDFDGAIAAYCRATELDPALAPAWKNLGLLLQSSLRMEECVEAFSRLLDLQPDNTEVCRHLAPILYGMGRLEQATTVYRHWLANDPDSPTAKHLLAALTGQGVPVRASDAYIVELFDQASSTFDEQLHNLEYRVPELLAAAVLKELAGRQRVDVLDAGCGTGMCGPHLRSTARRLVGVDLSNGMICKANERNVYDELHVAELTAFMNVSHECFDVVVSADTLVYFGALEAVVATTRNCLRSKGLFAFALERRDLGDAPYVIEPHGRYSHQEPYVVRVLSDHGFVIVVRQHIVLRKESNEDVRGLLIVAERPE